MIQFYEEGKYQAVVEVYRKIQESLRAEVDLLKKLAMQEIAVKALRRIGLPEEAVSLSEECYAFAVVIKGEKSDLAIEALY
jgi:uncharacterized alkaline shock family protein YloU